MDKQIIATLGPSSFSESVVKKMERSGVSMFRINLSHTNTDQIEKKIKYLKQNNM